MSIVQSFEISYLKAVLLLIFLVLVYVFGTIFTKVIRWSTWLIDVPGPKRQSFLLGSWKDFFQRDLITLCLKWMDEYGGVVKIHAFLGEPRLLISDPVALNHVLERRSYDYPKQKDAARVLRGLMGPGLLVSEGEQHKRQKQAIQPAFSPSKLKSLTPIFARDSRKLRDKLLTRLPSKIEPGNSQDQSSKPFITVDVLRPISRATLDALGHAGFGVSFNALSEEDSETFAKVASTSEENAPISNNPLSRAFDDVLALATGGAANFFRFILDISVSFFPILLYLPTGENAPEFKDASNRLMEKAKEVVDLARKDMERDSENEIENTRQDLLSTMLRANMNAKRLDEKSKSRSRSEKACLTDEELCGNVSTFMFAGHETSSVMMTWLLLHLAKKPEVQERLRSEIRSKRSELGLSSVSSPFDSREQVEPSLTSDLSFGVRETVSQENFNAEDSTAREFSFDELESMPYLDCVIKEALRISGPIHTTSRVSTVSDLIPVSAYHSPNVPSSGVRVSPGTLIIIPIEALGRDPKVWGQDADEFRPERWFDSNNEGSKRYTRAGGMAFLSGSRACIGNRFAIAELKSMLCVLINSLAFEPVPKIRILPNRWLVSRPWDTSLGKEQCPLRMSRAPI